MEYITILIISGGAGYLLNKWININTIPPSNIDEQLDNFKLEVRNELTHFKTELETIKLQLALRKPNGR